MGNEVILNQLIGRCYFKIVRGNSDHMLIEYDLKWKRDKCLAIGNNKIVKWLRDNITDCNETMERNSDNGKAVSIIKELRGVYNNLLIGFEDYLEEDKNESFIKENYRRG